MDISLTVEQLRDILRGKQVVVTREGWVGEQHEVRISAPIETLFETFEGDIFSADSSEESTERAELTQDDE